MHKLIHRPLGAQVLQARLGGAADPFYCSPLADQFQGPARGGVPVLFPQFAEYGPQLKHGFVRNRDWTLLAHDADAAQERLHYTLEVTRDDFPGWPHAARLELQAQATASRMDFTFTVLNTGNDAFSFTGGLHPYFAVNDLPQVQVEGLQGLTASDRYQPGFTRQEEALLQFDGAIFERLYDGCPPVTLREGSRRLRLTASGFDQWMVWNPGREEAKNLKDLPDGDWRRFVCIEPVRVKRPVVLEVGEEFVGTFAVAVEGGENQPDPQ